MVPFSVRLGPGFIYYGLSHVDLGSAPIDLGLLERFGPVNLGTVTAYLGSVFVYLPLVLFTCGTRSGTLEFRSFYFHPPPVYLGFGLVRLSSGCVFVSAPIWALNASTWVRFQVLLIISTAPAYLGFGFVDLGPESLTELWSCTLGPHSKARSHPKNATRRNHFSTIFQLLHKDQKQ